MDSHPILKPAQILGFQKIWQLGKFCPQVLVQWEGQAPSDATWESTQEFQQDFPDFNLEDKVNFEGEGNVASPKASPPSNTEEAQQDPRVRSNNPITRIKKMPKRFEEFVITTKK